jgi:hypothetical protein
MMRLATPSYLGRRHAILLLALFCGSAFGTETCPGFFRRLVLRTDSLAQFRRGDIGHREVADRLYSKFPDLKDQYPFLLGLDSLTAEGHGSNTNLAVVRAQKRMQDSTFTLSFNIEDTGVVRQVLPKTEGFVKLEWEPAKKNGAEFLQIVRKVAEESGLSVEEVHQRKPSEKRLAAYLSIKPGTKPKAILGFYQAVLSRLQE